MAQWVRRLNIKDAWKQAQEDEITSIDLAKVIVEKLKRFNLEDDWELQDIITEFESFIEDNEDDDSWFNSIFNSLYDWADTPLDNEWNGKKNCWIETF